MKHCPKMLALCALSLIGTACEEQIVYAPPTAPPVASASASAAPSASYVPAPPSDMDFVEGDRSRDPFRQFSDLFVEREKEAVRSQREVVLDTYSIDELKLVGIVLRASPPLAMLVDPQGKGHTIRRGQFVGRAEVVRAGTGPSYELNWRVEQIRDGDVVLVREDPQNPGAPSATKVIPIRPDGASAADVIVQG